MELKNRIIIKQPYITRNGSLYRINADIIENGTLHNLYAEVEEQYSEYLCTERADAFCYLALPVALREGYDIYCEAPLTEMLLHNLNEILIPHLAIGDKRITPIKVHASTANEYIGGSGVSTAISCGVDSMYTVMEYTNGNYQGLQLTHLFIASANAELWDFTDEDNLYTWVDKHKIQFDRYNIVSEMLGIPIVKVFSNFIWYICKRPWTKYHHLWTHHYISMANVLVLKKLWRIYFFSSTVDFTNFSLVENMTQDTDRHELLSMHVLSVPDFTCFSGGAKSDRVDKTLALVDYPPAQKVLHPCHSSGVKNCSNPTCGKCLRALLALDYYDKLDNMKDVFDIDRYRKDRTKYLWNLARLREKEFFTRLYSMFCEKYPDDMEKALKNYENYIKPIPRADYNVLQRAYNVSMKLLSVENPRECILRFFKGKGIENLYCSGSSVFGKKIISFIENDINVITYKNGKISDCDAAFILSTKDSEISDITKKLKTDKPVYNIRDINNWLSNDKKD